MKNDLSNRKENLVTLVKDMPLEKLIKPLSREILLYDTYIAGMTTIKDKNHLENLRDGDRLNLRRDPDNCFDKNTILILDVQNRRLGFVPEKDNVILARLMDAGKHLIAKVNGRIVGHMPKLVNINIYMIDF